MRHPLLAREIVESFAVLLKNEAQLLPLAKPPLRHDLLQQNQRLLLRRKP